VARLIHHLDPRERKQDLVILDCSTIMPELSGSEFFGHERGAFTGAVAARDGAFALADRGTLFLDEVGELPMNLQTQLLRVIQEQTFKRVGGNAWQRTSFRLVSATNRDLWAQVQRGEFRADLYFRLASFVCRLPPLRERPEDILPLARHFLKGQRPQREPPELDPSVQEYLLNRPYPGNVRDLRQVAARLLCRHAGKGPITVGCIPPDDRQAWYADETPWHEGGFELAIRRALLQGLGLKGISRTAEETAIGIAVAEAGGNLQQAAQRLGVTDRTLQLRRAAQRQES
jgi:transcriptional regulator with GAF, ATPase, and Fis domain